MLLDGPDDGPVEEGTSSMAQTGQRPGWLVGGTHIIGQIQETSDSSAAAPEVSPSLPIEADSIQSHRCANPSNAIPIAKAPTTSSGSINSLPISSPIPQPLRCRGLGSVLASDAVPSTNCTDSDW